MKLKFKNSRKDGRSLVCTSKAAEELRYKEAELIRAGVSEVFLPLEYEPKGKGYAFRYPLDNVETISERLKKPLASGHLEGMLLSLLEVSRACNQQDLSMQRILFQPEFAFFDSAHFALRLAYIPLKAKMEISGPLELIAHVASNAAFSGSETKKLAARMLDYSMGRAVFDLVEYEAHLRELGVIDLDEGGYLPRRTGIATATVDCRMDFGFDFVEKRISGGLVAADGGGGCALSGAAPGSNATASSSAVAGMSAVAHSGEAVQSASSFSFALIGSGEHWVLSDGVYLLGGSDDCQIVVPQLGVSRRHARVIVKDGRCLVEDLGSTNGTGIDGKRLEPGALVEIRPGQVLNLAKARLKLG